MTTPNFFRLSDGWSRFFFSTDILKCITPREWECFYKTPLEQTKLIILGNNNGTPGTSLWGEVHEGELLTPILLDMYKKLEEDGYYPTRDGSLEYLTRQGVLLMNIEGSEVWLSQLIEYIYNYNPNVILLCMSPQATLYAVAPIESYNFKEDGVFKRINNRLFSIYNRKLKI